MKYYIYFNSVILISYFLDVIEEKSLENNKGLVLIGIICVVFIIICFVFVCVFLIKYRKGKVSYVRFSMIIFFIED